LGHQNFKLILTLIIDIINEIIEGQQMKNFVTFILLFSLFVLSGTTPSQVIYSHKIDSILNLVSVQSISRMNKEMSADTIVTIGGIPQILYSRYWPTPGNVKAAQYIYEKFQSFGLNAKYMISSTTNYNVYAEKTGTKYPNKKFLIGGHYDDITNPYPGMTDTIYGADDNASGIAAVLETARLLANMNLDYTVIFVAFDEEEGYGNGSAAFADTLVLRGDTLLGMLNLDMIAWDNNNDTKADIWANSNSVNICDLLISCNNVYQPGLILTKKFDGYSSDEQLFWLRGFKAISLAEEEGDFNPNWHKITDKFNSLNIQYFLKMTKLSIATLLTWATDNYLFMSHNLIQSSMDTSTKVALVTIGSPNSNIRIGAGINSPRLYYKFGNAQHNFVNAFEIIGNTYKFRIPGRPAGSKISYYIAAQDSAGNGVATLPYGGSGVNPPGTTPPPTQYIYYVWTTYNYCTNNIKQINDLEWTQDTIHLSQQGIVKDVDVTLNLNHSNDGDLLIKLQTPGNVSNLSQFNGQGGQNYTNTVFDDSATIPITQGTPPFTGTFKPQGLLANFNNQQLAGDWILRIYDINAGNHGALLNWCLKIKYENQVGINNINSTVPNGYKLFQNYPNPFNGRTVIGYSLLENGYITLKIYDILGKEVATLVNENLKAGQYEVVFDGNNFPSGIYFYKLTCHGQEEFTDVKRMVLIK
jgi:subtilisin-like proprotein convertase family protein